MFAFPHLVFSYCFFFKQKTAYEMRISDWSSDVCSSDLEIDRFEAHSRLLPHVVPHPFALYTNGLSIGRLTDDGLPSHYVMVQTIRRKLLSWSPSIFVGYNSIRIDEEMLRQAFFQTLHPAYLTSNHGHCRADALGLMTAADRKTTRLKSRN